ncbi:protein LTO1 homolog isoform X2 [Scleropages formosus]|uniref:protein LTO1 homolog isoform X2 n=1 Tax=Scleropages formosus TaxID=113540 RepID=UPI0008789560|nr:protein LTO1 homolog isoform X2 [Scleropages formosus]
MWLVPNSTEVELLFGVTCNFFITMASGCTSEDLFDAIIMADDRFHDEGFQEGFDKGTRQGLIEGRNHGATHGARLSAELSFYYGFAFTWKCIFQDSPEPRTRKKLKALENLLALIQSFPHDDPQYGNLQEDVGKVCSLVNVPSDFRDYVSKGEEMSF